MGHKFCKIDFLRIHQVLGFISETPPNKTTCNLDLSVDSGSIPCRVVRWSSADTPTRI